MKFMNDEQREIWEKLKRWHFDDIEKCLNADANFAAAKMELTFIDILGAFYGGLIEDKGQYYVLKGRGRYSKNIKTCVINGRIYEETGTKRQFLNFTKNYLNEFYIFKIKSNSKKIIAADILYEHFRCGLIHEGFPKYGTGIYKSNDGELFSFDQGVKVALNIITLRDRLMIAVEEFENDLIKKERIMRWQQRFDYLNKLKI